MQVNYNSGFYYRLTLSSFPNGFFQAGKDALIADTAASGNNFRVSSNYVSFHIDRQRLSDSLLQIDPC